MTISHRGGDAPFADTQSTAELLRALADPGRLTILTHLFRGEHNVRELTRHLGLAQSTVSAHLASLKACGLVTSRAEGRSSMYAVAHPARTRALLSAVEDLVEGIDRPADRT